MELRAAEQRQREAAADARRLGIDTGDTMRGALGEGLEVESGLERAVAGAIGAFVDAQVAANVRDAQASIDAGASAVVVPAPARASSRVPPGARPLREAIVACPAPMRDHVERLLADAWLVDDLEQVAPGQSGVFVNAEGVVFRPADGTVSSTQAAWARKALHRRALKLQDEAAGEVSTLEPLVADALATREARRRRLLASERAEARVGERLVAERAVSAARAERLERITADLAEAERLKADALDGREIARRRVDELATELDVAQQAVGSARDAAHAGAAELERLRTALREARSTSAAVDARAAGIQAQAAAARALIGAAESLPQDLALVARAAIGPRRRRRAASRRMPRPPPPRSATARAAFATAEERLSDAMRAVEAAEAGATMCRERLHGAEVELRIAEERATEAGPPPDEPSRRSRWIPTSSPQSWPTSSVAASASVRSTSWPPRSAPSSPSARLTSPSRSRISTRAARRCTRTSVSWMPRWARASRRSSRRCRTRFSEVVELLFPGGSGRLRLVEPDEEGGDEGVEVEVIPAGKRPRALSLMSGGERSLIAMGFCLALAMARPAPFYLLDEVEAALDDANLRRFLGVVRRLADETQFVDHHPPAAHRRGRRHAVRRDDGAGRRQPGALTPTRRSRSKGRPAPTCGASFASSTRDAYADGPGPDPWAELFELPIPVDEEVAQDGPRRGMFGRLRDKLATPQQAISPQLAAIYAPKLVTEDTWDDLEEALILADCGMEADRPPSSRTSAARRARGASRAARRWRRRCGARSPGRWRPSRPGSRWATSRR